MVGGLRNSVQATVYSSYYIFILNLICCHENSLTVAMILRINPLTLEKVGGYYDYIFFWHVLKILGIKEKALGYCRMGGGYEDIFFLFFLEYT